MAGEEQTIIAKFIADTSGFTSGAQEVIAQSRQIETATSGATKGTEEASAALSSFGSNAQKAGQGVTTVASGMKSAGEGAGALAKDAESAAAGIATIGDAGGKAGKGAGEAATGLVAAGKAGEEAGTGTKAAAASIESVGTSSSKAAGATSEVGASVAASGKAAEGAARGFSMMEAAMGAMMAIQLVQMLVQVIQAADKMNQDLKDSAMAFTYLTGSAQKADQELKNLNNTFAAKAWGSKVIDDAAQSLRMMGKSAGDTQKEVERVSDALAAMGQDGSKLKPAVMAMEDINAKTIITKDDIKKLQDTGVDAYAALAEGLSAQRGKTIDAAEAQKEVNAGAIHGKEAYQALLTGMMEYSGAAEEKSKSLSAEWQQFGEEAAPAIGPFIEELTQFLHEINQTIEGAKQLKAALDSIGGGNNFLGSAGMAIQNSGLDPLGPMGGFVRSGFISPLQFASGYAAGGTNLPQGWRVVGEDGPELQWSPGGDTIVPSGADPMSFIGSSGGGGGLSMPSMSFGGGGSAPQTVELSIYMDTVAVARQTIPLIAPQIRVLTGGRR